MTPAAILALRAKATQGEMRVTPSPRYLDGHVAQAGPHETASLISDAHTEHVATFWAYLMDGRANAEYVAALWNHFPAIAARLGKLEAAAALAKDALTCDRYSSFSCRDFTLEEHHCKACRALAALEDR